MVYVKPSAVALPRLKLHIVINRNRILIFALGLHN